MLHYTYFTSLVLQCMLHAQRNFSLFILTIFVLYSCLTTLSIAMTIQPLWWINECLWSTAEWFWQGKAKTPGQNATAFTNYMDWPGNEPRPLLETPAINRFFCFLYLYMYFFVLTVPALPFVLTVQHNTNIQAPAGVEPAGPASNRPQTLAVAPSP